MIQDFKHSVVFRRECLLTIFMLFVSPLGSAALHAQEDRTASQTSSQAEICTAFEVEIGQGQPRQLLAACGGQAVLLGASTSYSVVETEDHTGLLIDLNSAGTRRLFLVTEGAEGPAVEELTGLVARAAGKAPMAPITEVHIDLENFSRSGVIGVSRDAEGSGSAEIETINVADRVANLRARATSAQN